MTRAEQFEALALRCEQATRPDRELDLAIYLMCNPDSEIARWVRDHRRGLDGKLGYAWDLCGANLLFEARNAHGDCYYNGGIPLPTYSASLDAARSISSALLIHASDNLIERLAMIALASDTSKSQTQHIGVARTLELAWCAAALRARAQMERGE